VRERGNVCVCHLDDLDGAVVQAGGGHELRGAHHALSKQMRTHTHAQVHDEHRQWIRASECLHGRDGIAGATNRVERAKHCGEIGRGLRPLINN
jgi:hypothetical protein